MTWKREDLKLPKGWWWLTLYGRRVFQAYDSQGRLQARWVSVQYNPADRQFATDGSVTAAVERGTAREIHFSLDDMQQIGADYLEKVFDSENYVGLDRR